MVGDSPALRRVLDQIAQVAPTDSTVLIQGETGTGKELVARAIHDGSARRERPLVADQLRRAAARAGRERALRPRERRLHRRAAAAARALRAAPTAARLFLDEIGELPLEAQAKLLRVLQEHEFERVGGTRTLRADVRVIAATNRDLEAKVAPVASAPISTTALNVFPIAVPPLRERRDDIPRLLQHFAAKAARKLGRTLDGVSPAVLRARTRRYDWPGNVRELENLVERAMIMCNGALLDGSDLFSFFAQERPRCLPRGRSVARGHGARAHPARARSARAGDRRRRRRRAHPRAQPEHLRGRMRKLGIKKP